MNHLRIIFGEPTRKDQIIRSLKNAPPGGPRETLAAHLCVSSESDGFAYAEGLRQGRYHVQPLVFIEALQKAMATADITDEIKRGTLFKTYVAPLVPLLRAPEARRLLMMAIEYKDVGLVTAAADTFFDPSGFIYNEANSKTLQDAFTTVIRADWPEGLARLAWFVRTRRWSVSSESYVFKALDRIKPTSLSPEMMKEVLKIGPYILAVLVNTNPALLKQHLATIAVDDILLHEIAFGQYDRVQQKRNTPDHDEVFAALFSAVEKSDPQKIARAIIQLYNAVDGDDAAEWLFDKASPSLTDFDMHHNRIGQKAQAKIFRKCIPGAFLAKDVDAVTVTADYQRIAETQTVLHALALPGNIYQLHVYDFAKKATLSTMWERDQDGNFTRLTDRYYDLAKAKGNVPGLEKAAAAFVAQGGDAALLVPQTRQTKKPAAAKKVASPRS